MERLRNDPFLPLLYEIVKLLPNNVDVTADLVFEIISRNIKPRIAQLLTAVQILSNRECEKAEKKASSLSSLNQDKTSPRKRKRSFSPGSEGSKKASPLQTLKKQYQDTSNGGRSYRNPSPERAKSKEVRKVSMSKEESLPKNLPNCLDKMNREISPVSLENVKSGLETRKGFGSDRKVEVKGKIVYKEMESWKKENTRGLPIEKGVRRGCTERAVTSYND